MKKLINVFFLVPIAAVLCFFLHYKWPIQLDTSDGAIIMAFGILINGAARQVPFMRIQMGSFLTALLMILFLLLITSLLYETISGSLYRRHLAHPVLSFSAGTWVAAAAVTADVILKEWSTLKVLAAAIFFMSILLWSGYMVLMYRNYVKILKNSELRESVHGILLLACVSTQSIVVDGGHLLTGVFPAIIWKILISVGILFYLLGFVLIASSYFRLAKKTVIQQWKNTNCILHGAMSITGLAASITSSFSVNFIALIWLWVILIFLLVEGIEILRAISRIQSYGFKEGLFTYSSSQWARNFTFGMLLAFTMNLPFQESFLSKIMLIHTFHSLILTFGKYVVIALFITEACIWIRHWMRLRPKPKERWITPSV